MEKKIILDIGHGGTDTGASGNGVIEKNLNLSQGLKLKKRLEEHKLKVVCTRTNDKTLSLTERCNIANSSTNDNNTMFLSFHHNSYTEDSAGSETFRSIHNNKDSRISKFCDSLLYDMSKLGFKNRGNKTRESTKYPNQDYYTIINKSNMKAVIFEPYFLSNKKDVELGKKHADNIIEVIVQNICWYYSIPYTPIKKVEEKVVEKHWAEDSYVKLKQSGVHISDKLYDTPLLRGSAFSMMHDIMNIFNSEIKKLNDEIIKLQKEIKKE